MTSVDGATLPLLQPSESPPRRLLRPNYGKIHAKPLPVIAYPLPPLIPHNPLSIFHIAFTYLYQLLAPPSSHPKIVYQAYFSPETRSVHVTDETAIRALWESGFFGKGSLSRSEPSWLDREKKRRGLVANETSEEFTAQRREERKRFKQERARNEREAIEEKLKEEKRIHKNGHVAEPTARSRYEGLDGGPVNSLAESMESLFEQQPLSPPVPPRILLSLSGAANDTDSGREDHVSHFQNQPAASDPSKVPEQDLEAEAARIENQEHLQLNLSEAFFLVYALGILQIRAQDTSALLFTEPLFTLFRRNSYFPPREIQDLQPDDPFLLQYVVYHHFRSLGWVVRPGIKFAVDWLLYLRGPVFSHAEFAVIVLPAYTHPYWRSSQELQKLTNKKESKSWWWLHCVNRVQSQVRKSLVICYVEVPPPVAIPASIEREVSRKGMDIAHVLTRYKYSQPAVEYEKPSPEILAKLRLALATRDESTILNSLCWLFEALAVGDLVVALFGINPINRLQKRVRQKIQEAVAEDDRPADSVNMITESLIMACNIFFICEKLGVGSFFFLRPNLNKNFLKNLITKEGQSFTNMVGNFTNRGFRQQIEQSGAMQVGDAIRAHLRVVFKLDQAEPGSDTATAATTRALGMGRTGQITWKLKPLEEMKEAVLEKRAAFVFS